MSDSDLIDWDAVQRHRAVVHDDTMSDMTRQRSRDALMRLFGAPPEAPQGDDAT